MISVVIVLLFSKINTLIESTTISNYTVDTLFVLTISMLVLLYYAAQLQDSIVISIQSKNISLSFSQLIVDSELDTTQLSYTSPYGIRDLDR